MIKITEWKEIEVSGAKRANIGASSFLDDWFVGFGKDESCRFEGTWWDMICFARNVLASENTKLCAPEYYHPEMNNSNYAGEEQPYVFTDDPDVPCEWCSVERNVNGYFCGAYKGKINHCPNCGRKL